MSLGGGNSKQIDASQIGGVLKITETVDVSDPDNVVITLDKTYNEIKDAVDNGALPFIYRSDVSGDDANYYIYNVASYYYDSAQEEYCVEVDGGHLLFNSSTADGVLTNGEIK